VDYARQSQEVWNMYKLRKEKERLRKENQLKNQLKRKGPGVQKRQGKVVSATVHLIDGDCF
jgi:hypothetical protein